MRPISNRVLQFLTAFTIALAAPTVGWTGAIDAGIFYQFGFTDAGVATTGCQPEDPAGLFCIPSSGTPTQFADAPAWTFIAPAGGSTLLVVDAFSSGDQFEVLDFGSPLGSTSLPIGGTDCGDDPVSCLADTAMSQAVFALAAGAHSITIVPLLSPDGLGSGYFKVDAVAEVSTSGTLALTLLGLAVIYQMRRRVSRT